MTKMGRAAKLRRVQELFTEGRTITLEGAVGEPLRFYVTKPTAFERDEASKDGRAGRARRVVQFDRSEDDQALVDARLGELSSEEIIEALVGSKSNEFYVRAADEIRADKNWQERMLVMERGAALLEDRRREDELSEDERSRLQQELDLVDEINVEYLKRVGDLVTRYGEDYADELREGGQEALREEYRKTYREMHGTEAFLTERRLTELYFAVRDCEATEDPSKPDGFDHSRCNGHVTRLAEHRHEVQGFPDALLLAARQALEELNMTPQDAAFSGAPTSSFASSEQPSEAEESPVSTPAETSPEPVGT